MVDISVKVLTPATSFALLSLAELKTSLGITDTDSDASLTQLIDRYSDIVATLCDRVFARERVEETWRDLLGNRLFLQHWPVRPIIAGEPPVATPGIETITVNGTLLDAADYELDVASGKVTFLGTRASPIVITYTGGFDLPDEAPPALKQAAEMLVSGARRQTAQVVLESGPAVRMIAHKDARVMYHPPSTASSTASSSATSSAIPAQVTMLLSKYMRVWA